MSSKAHTCQACLWYRDHNCLHRSHRQVMVKDGALITIFRTKPVGPRDPACARFVDKVDVPLDKLLDELR